MAPKSEIKISNSVPERSLIFIKTNFPVLTIRGVMDVPGRCDRATQKKEDNVRDRKKAPISLH